jgi:hypothetical protein
MSSLGPISPRSGYSGGGGGGYYPSDDRQKKKNLSLFDSSNSNHNRSKNKPNNLKVLETKFSDGSGAIITEIDDLLENVEDAQQVIHDDEVISNYEDLMEQERININYQEFADDEDASTSGDKVRYLNMIVNNYLKHIMVFCVVVVAVSVLAFFILSFINGF